MSLAQIFIGLTLLFCGGVTNASDRIVSMAFYEDVGGQLGFEQLPQTDFTLFEDILAKGYKSSIFWVRLHVENDPSNDHLILRVRPNFLDEVSLFDPANGSMGRAFRGDERSQRDAYESLNLNFTIASGDKPRDIWLRIRTKSTLLFSVELLSLNEASQKDIYQELKAGFYLAWVVLFIIWGLLHGWSLRDDLIRFFVIKEALCLIYMLGFLGFLRNFLPETLTWISGPFVDLSLGAYVAASFYFDYRFLKPYEPHRYLLAVLRVMPAFLPFYLLLWLMGEEQSAFVLNMSLAVLAPVLTFALACSIPPGSESQTTSERCLSRKMLISLYGLILFGLSVSTLPAMGWFQASFLVFDGFLVYSLLSGLGILVILEIQIRMREKRMALLETRNQEVKRLYEIEQARRDQQDQFLAMLTHELRTPLSVVRMSIADADAAPGQFSHAERSIDEISAILDRCLTADKLESGGMGEVDDSFDLREEVISVIGASTDPSRIELSQDGEVTLNTDRICVRLILNNLMDNALKYSEKRSPVKVRIKPQQNSCTITVENIPAGGLWPDSEKLFQKYYRSPASQYVSGTGLGLYVAIQLSHRLGGDLTYTSHNAHVRFTLCLPL